MRHNTGRRRRSNPRLAQKFVDHAYAEHKNGVPIVEIVRRNYSDWGCESQKRATELLRIAFRESGYEMRGRGRPETSGISKGRAPTRRRGFPLSDRARSEYAAKLEAEMERALADAEMRELILEQQKEARRFRLPARSWLVSLEETLGDGDESYAERVAVAFARRRGDFKPEAPWVEPLIRRIDDLSERCAA